MKSHFHLKGLAPRFALRRRLKVIWKWPIVFPFSPSLNTGICDIGNRSKQLLLTVGHGCHGLLQMLVSSLTRGISGSSDCEYVTYHNSLHVFINEFHFSCKLIKLLKVRRINRTNT